MKLTLDTIKDWYQFRILEFLQGETIVKDGKCSQWIRRKELKNDKDLIYIRIRIEYHGPDYKGIIYNNFHLEDADGYFNKSLPPEDYMDKTLCPGDSGEGGLLFALYQDISPILLWFDTGIFYENSKDPILLDIALPLAESHTRTQILAKEKLAQSYSQQIANQEKTVGEMSYKLDSFLQTVSQHLGASCKKIASGYILRVQLTEGRKQNLIINFTGEGKENCQFLTIGTICAPAKDAKNDRTFLKLNPMMTYGAIGITKIEGEEYYVITETLPFSNLQCDLICNVMKYIASKGDWLEIKLTGGLDIQ